jgi:hypothetical protein
LQSHETRFDFANSLHPARNRDKAHRSSPTRSPGPRSCLSATAEPGDEPTIAAILLLSFAHHRAFACFRHASSMINSALAPANRKARARPNSPRPGGPAVLHADSTSSAIADRCADRRRISRTNASPVYGAGRGDKGCDSENNESGLMLDIRQ